MVRNGREGKDEESLGNIRGHHEPHTKVPDTEPETTGWGRLGLATRGRTGSTFSIYEQKGLT